MSKLSSNGGYRILRVLEAIQTVHRELFVPAELQHRAYDDVALPIEQGQTISQPFIVAHMTELLQLRGDESVLEIGTGTGYQTAILSQLCRHVTTIERIPQLSATAIARLQQLQVDNVEFYVGDGTLGHKTGAPYDAIIVTAGAPEVPSPLYNQLKVGGRLVIPVGDEDEQVMQVIHKHEDGPRIREASRCRFVRLIGEAGWEVATD